ncbi:ribonuclease D [Glaciecola siphonariae]|uniref:Ribonuclease D n=1 Tax=Glaciecola siphonariae TaxID=521012 RepID=A0ABV9LTZ8_9ALTE
MNEQQIAKLAQLQYDYITSEIALEALCKELSKAKVITLDTEFVRTRTLKPQLGLLQVFDGHHLALIDPVAINDLSAFTAILQNPDIVKVLHSCSEDIDALHSNLGVTPHPLFDTQFAASMLGKGASIGYANLIETYFDIALDKGESRTDWMARPLSSNQLDYAAADVTYLMAAFDELAAELDEKGLRHCVFAESAALIEKKTVEFPSEYAYLTLSNNWKLSERSLYALKQLAKWRLDTARKNDIAINFVIKEASMLDIAVKLPQSTSGLHQIHDLYGKQVRLYGQDILAITHKAKHIDENEFVPKIKRLIEFPLSKKAASDIKQLVERVAAKHDIPAAVLASKKQISQVLKWCWFELDETVLHGLRPDLLSGWRRELFIGDLETLFVEKGSEQQGKYETLRSL